MTEAKESIFHVPEAEGRIRAFLDGLNEVEKKSGEIRDILSNILRDDGTICIVNHERDRLIKSNDDIGCTTIKACIDRVFRRLIENPRRLSEQFKYIAENRSDTFLMPHDQKPILPVVILDDE